MLRHPKNIHSREISGPTQTDVCSEKQSASSLKRFKSAHSQATLLSFIKKDTKEEMFAKLVAVDGFPPSAICKSEFIRQAFSDKSVFFFPKQFKSCYAVTFV